MTIALPPAPLRAAVLAGFSSCCFAPVDVEPGLVASAFAGFSALGLLSGFFAELSDGPGFDAGVASAFLGSGLALPLLSTEMVSVGFSVSVDFAEALVFGVSGVFTIGPLQFAVIPKTASGTASRYDGP